MALSEKTNYSSEAISRLLTTLQGGGKLEALVQAYVDRCQELEAVAFDLYEQLDIDVAEGDRLDRIGSLVNISRGARDDDSYRLRIRAEIAILNSDGLAEDLFNVLKLLLGQPSPIDTSLEEAFPKAVIMRARNFATNKTDAEMDSILALLSRAASAGTEVDLVFSTLVDDDDNIFHFSTTADTTESSATYGTENGALCGAAI